MSRDNMAKIQERCTIGKNYQGRFWCGFCKEVVPLKTRLNDAWDERFNHIEEHSEDSEKPKDVAQWVTTAEGKPKGQLWDEDITKEDEEHEQYGFIIVT